MSKTNYFEVKYTYTSKIVKQNHKIKILINLQILVESPFI